MLTNTRTVGATSSVSIEVAINELLPINVVDMALSDPISAYCEVVTNQGNVIELGSNEIYAQIDTEAHISSVYKDGAIFESAAGVPAELLENLPAGTYPWDYVYARWYTYHSHANNQPHSLHIEDVLSNAYEIVDGRKQILTEGIFLGSKNFEGEINTTADIDFTAPIVQNQMNTSTQNQYDKTVNMWSAYLKADLEPSDANEEQRIYYLENEVTWYLTETDGPLDNDPQKVTSKTDSVVLQYTPMTWRKPTGSFIVHKWTERHHEEDWDYGYGLNLLEAGEEIDMNFLVQTRGYGFTSIYSVPNADPASSDEELQDSYGRLGWKQVTEDYQTFFNFDTEPLTAEDFEFTKLRLTVPNMYRYGKTSGGSYGYVEDSSLFVPSLQVEVRLEEGDWQPAAYVEYTKAGGFTSTPASGDLAGVTWNPMEETLYFPENVTDVRWTYVSNVAAESNGKDKCDLGAVIWDIYPSVKLKPSKRVLEHVADLFEVTDNPTTKFKNDVVMDAYGWLGEAVDPEGIKVVDDDFDASRATISGAGYGVQLEKVGEERSDPENCRMLIHYTATVTEQSQITDREEYFGAVARNVIPAETSGIWYDLLPPMRFP